MDMMNGSKKCAQNGIICAGFVNNLWPELADREATRRDS